MDYLFKSSVCMVAFYGLYFFGFRRLSFHTLNRFYLLASLALSLTIPMLSYEREEVVIIEPSPVLETVHPEEYVSQSIDNQEFESTPQIIEPQEIQVDWIQVLSIIYLLGVIIMLFLFFRNLILIVRMLVCSQPFTSTSLSEQVRVLVTERGRGNSSFFNYIFLNPDNLNPHEQAIIIAHEGFHAKRLHTLDLLLVSILKAIFWFNPIIYFYQKSLKQIHEYEVDALMSATYDSRDYAHLLLKLTVDSNAMIINQFSTKPLSDRIQFLFTKPTKNMKKLLYFLVIPIIGVGVMAFAQEKVKMIYKEKEGEKIINEISTPDFKKVELKEENLKKVFSDTLKKEKIIQIDSTKFTYYLGVKPTKKGSIDSFKVIVNNKFLTEGKDYIVKNNTIHLDQKYGGEKISFRIYSTAIGNMLYPELALLEDIPLVKSLFSVKMPSFLASNGNSISSKTIRIPFPDARPIKRQDTLRTILETNKLGKNPLVFINGEEYPSSILFRINPDIVTSTMIGSPESKKIIEEYGEKALNGVVKISTKKDAELLLDEQNYKYVIENIKRQLIPSQVRVKRVLLKDFNGKITEKVSVIDTRTGIDKISMRTEVGKKAVFFIDDVLVSEEEVNNYKGELFYNGYTNKIIEEKYPQEIKKADMIFNLKTKLK